MLKSNKHLYECLVTETAFDKLVLSDATVVVGVQSVKDLSEENYCSIPKSSKKLKISPIYSKMIQSANGLSVAKGNVLMT